MSFRERHLERIIGGFIIACGTAFFIMLLYAIIGSGWLTSWNRYHLILDHGTGLVPGVEVTVAGMKVGSVQSVALTPERDVALVLAVERRYANYVRTDTVGRVSMTLTGKVVILEGGSDQAEVLPNGGSLVSGTHFDVLIALEHMDLVGNLQRLEAILKDINNLAAQLQLGDGELPEALADVSRLLKDMQDGKGLMGKALKDDAFANELITTVHNMNTMAKQLEGTAARLDPSAASMEKAGDAVVTGMGDIKRAADSLDRTADSVSVAAAKLVGATERLNSSLIELDKTMRAIQRLPLVRGKLDKGE